MVLMFSLVFRKFIFIDDLCLGCYNYDSGFLESCCRELDFSHPCLWSEVVGPQLVLWPLTTDK